MPSVVLTVAGPGPKQFLAAYRRSQAEPTARCALSRLFLHHREFCQRYRGVRAACCMMVIRAPSRAEMIMLDRFITEFDKSLRTVLPPL